MLREQMDAAKLKFDREILKKYLDVTSDTNGNHGRLYGPVRNMLGIKQMSDLDSKLT